MVATVHTFLTTSKHVQPDEQLLHLGLQNTGANQVQIAFVILQNDKTKCVVSPKTDWLCKCCIRHFYLTYKK